MGYIYRFVTPQAILIAAREKAILEKREQGYRGPVGAIQLGTKETIKAFLEYFDKLGEEGWLYCGTAEYPDLPYGGCYVFRKEKQPKAKISKIGRITKVERIDELPVTETSTITEDEDIYAEDEILDLTSEEPEEYKPEELINAPADVVNDILFKRQLIASEQDPDLESDIIDELETAQSSSSETVEQPEQDLKIIRHQLYELFKVENQGKKAIWLGKETKQFLDWLDEKKSKYDPFYQAYIEETDKLPIHREKETAEYKQWLKDKQAGNNA